MPIYEYQCAGCGHHFEAIQSFKEEALIQCPVCGESSLKKLISAPAFHLKGTGWYVTDFKNTTKPSPQSQGGKEEESKGKEKKKAEGEIVKKESTESKETKSTTVKKADKSDSPST